ncbi:MAG TPA: threonine--tRNA ligase [Actinopolymorphaceae bacterium]
MQISPRVPARVTSDPPGHDAAVGSHPGATPDTSLDHRVLGRDLGIYDTHELAGAGFPLWLPDGAAIIAELERYILDAERRAGYRHVRTPPVGKRELYERSGHWAHFSADMFPLMPVGGDELVLRPTLCPHHALVFGSRLRSHRELPLRLAEFGQQFRMERSGVVSGLTRVRGMILDDAHVFCAPDQGAEEVALVLRMIDEAYVTLGIRPAYAMLSLRGPGKSYAGSDAMWAKAEEILRTAADLHGLELRPAEGEAAFYGPKIDIQVYDAGGREFTLSTAQVDLYQPERFDLSYVAPSGDRVRPVIVHRSVLASMERMVAYLLESSGGALPPWLAPLQVLVLPVGEEQAAYAWEIAARARQAGLRVEVDDRGETLSARIRAASERKVPYVAIVGSREEDAHAVSVRLRGDRAAARQPMAMPRFVDAVRSVVEARTREVTLASH